MKPALTAGEWASYPDIAGGTPEPGQEPLYHHTRHGIAAANLHNQEYGFTREDVEDERAELGYLQDYRKLAFEGAAGISGKKIHTLIKKKKNRIARLQALLPDE